MSFSVLHLEISKVISNNFRVDERKHFLKLVKEFIVICWPLTKIFKRNI